MGSNGIPWTRVEQGKHRSNLEEFLAREPLTAGGQRVSGLRVNPEWTDWLMGFPTNWTAYE
jgi:hypothetical protein